MAKPSKDQLNRYCELRERKRKLESEARSLETEINHLADVCLTHLESIDKDSCKVHGFQLLVEPGRGYVAWKTELVKAIGADEVAKIADAAPRSPKLTVQKA